MNWRVKGVVQRALGLAPGGSLVHRALQMAVGELKATDRYVASKVDDWGVMTALLLRHGFQSAGHVFLEIGTGWLPVLPQCILMAGAAQVVTLDQTRHLTRRGAERSAQALARHVDQIARIAELPVDMVARLHAAILANPTGKGLDYRAPADARATGLPEGCIDVVFSNSVFEHVGAGDVQPLFAEARRILRPGGIMFHSINCGDHYAYFDRTISQVNYLRYSDEEWSAWNNRFLHQNRLRAIEFEEAARAVGFVVEEAVTHPKARRMEALAAIPVHPQWSRFPPEELSRTSVDLVARKPR